MRINWIGVVIATLVITILRCLWSAHLGGADWAHMVPRAISAVEHNHAGGLMALVDALIVALGLGWLIGRLGKPSLATGVGIGLAAAVCFAATTAAAGYVSAGVVHGPGLHAMLMDAVFYLAAYAAGGAVIGAIGTR